MDEVKLVSKLDKGEALENLCCQLHHLQERKLQYSITCMITERSSDG